MLGGLKTAFRGLSLATKSPLNPILTSVHLVLFLRQFVTGSKAVDDVVKSSEHSLTWTRLPKLSIIF